MRTTHRRVLEKKMDVLVGAIGNKPSFPRTNQMFLPSRGEDAEQDETASSLPDIESFDEIVYHLASPLSELIV